MANVLRNNNDMCIHMCVRAWLHARITPRISIARHICTYKFMYMYICIYEHKYIYIYIHMSVYV